MVAFTRCNCRRSHSNAPPTGSRSTANFGKDRSIDWQLTSREPTAAQLRKEGRKSDVSRLSGKAGSDCCRRHFRQRVDRLRRDENFQQEKTTNEQKNKMK